MSALVRYDAMCRAIDAAYAVDEVKAIHDQAQMLQAAARVAQNTEAEDRAYQIRMRAARKAGALTKKIEKAQGQRTDLGTSPRGREKSGVLSDAGISTQQASEWERLSDVQQDEFEAALATKSVRDLLDKPMPVSDDALLFIGTMRDFERRGYLAGAPADFMATMTETMLAEVHRIAPLASAWLARVGEDASEAEIDLASTNVDGEDDASEAEPYSPPAKTPKEWKMSFSNMAEESISLAEYWEKEFGQWRAFKANRSMILLARKAAASWSDIAASISTKKD